MTRRVAALALLLASTTPASALAAEPAPLEQARSWSAGRTW